MNTLAAAGTMACHSCGSRDRPTIDTSFSQTTGALIVRWERHINGHLCARCVKYWFWQFTQHNLVLGWWRPISALATVVFTIGNIVNYLRAKAKFRSQR
jgi:hypothetical protein